MSTKTISHRVAVIGGGNAGISLAARLRRAGMTDIGIIEPAESHFYQPLWTLVGGGRAVVQYGPQAPAIEPPVPITELGAGGGMSLTKCTCKPCWNCTKDETVRFCRA